MRSLIFASALLAGWSCARGPEMPVGEPKEPAGTATAPAAAADGLCAEHGVLQVVCPKCNVALAAVFQAKGDWCAEHGFPESFCPLCHPERGGRPAADLSAKPSDGAPADGLKVRFKTREAARLAGIETALAVEAAAEDTVRAVARLVYDATRVALVSAPAPGVVTQIRADVGATVRRGGALAIIQSPVIGAGRSQEAAARSRLAFAESTLRRRRELLTAGAASPREVQEAEQEQVSASAELAALESQLGLVGGGGGGVGGGGGGAYTLVAPLAGEVTRREVSIGMGVEGGAPLFEIVDASTLWAELDVAELDLVHLQVGARAAITLDTLPERVFEGSVSYIAPMVSLSTRTALVRVPLDNADRALRGNMYGSGEIAVSDALPSVTVPAAAVQRAGGVDLVFVRLAEDEYEVRRVKLRSRQGGVVRLSGGVKPEEAVVTLGSFLLKTETLKDSIGAGCCDVE